MMVSDIDLTDRATWPEPVETSRTKHPVTGANQYRVEYTVPMSPDILMAALASLPSEIPRGVSTFIRTRMTKANVQRDGRHLGGFLIEVSWPPVDLSTVPLDMDDEGRVETTPKARSRRK